MSNAASGTTQFAKPACEKIDSTVNSCGPVEGNTTFTVSPIFRLLSLATESRMAIPVGESFEMLPAVGCRSNNELIFAGSAAQRKSTEPLIFACVVRSPDTESTLGTSRSLSSATIGIVPVPKPELFTT